MLFRAVSCLQYKDKMDFKQISVQYCNVVFSLRITQHSCSDTVIILTTVIAIFHTFCKVSIALSLNLNSICHLNITMLKVFTDISLSSSQTMNCYLLTETVAILGFYKQLGRPRETTVTTP